LYLLCLLLMPCFSVYGQDSGREPVIADGQAELEDRVRSLELQLAGAKDIMAAARPDGSGYLEDLQRKALAYEAVSAEMAKKNKDIEALKAEMARLQALNSSLTNEVAELRSATNSLSVEMAELQKDRVVIKESLDSIRKGKFQYYQVREGDTCESIAAQKGTYNDASKAVLIRQANRGGVVDLDKLVPGEVLVIPFFSLGGNYEF
jgi:chromosome segregation ATPase